MKDLKYWRWWLALLVSAAGLFYAPVLKGDFVYDDQWYIVQNESIHRFQPGRYFTQPTTTANPLSGLQGDVYRPLLSTIYAVQWRLWGAHPKPFHAVNLLLHLLNGVLVALVLAPLLNDARAALIGVAIFLFHPVQVQTAAWIAQQSNTWSTFFMLLTLWAVIPATASAQLVRRRRLAIVAFAAALFTKEQALVLPILLVLLWLWDRKNVALARCWPLGIVALIYMGCRSWYLPHWSQLGPQERQLFADLTTGLVAFPVYLAKLVLPMALRASYRYPSFNWPVIIGSTVIWWTFCLGVGWAWKQRRKASLGALWILIALLPALQLIPIRTFVAERLLYVPMIGFALFVATFAMRNRWTKAACALWFCFLVAQTARALPAWRSERALWENAVRYDPMNGFAWASLADAETDRDAAIGAYHRVLLMHPSPELAFSTKTNLSWLLLHKPDLSNALFWAEQAEQLRPDHPAPVYNRCLIYIAKKDFAKARALIGQIRQRFPGQTAMIADLEARLPPKK
jgi:protein O-mannosyl-transferase